ncbi:MAG: hypothetical protein RLZZ282_717 [Verrucomicrobiota bacterium]
MPTWPSAKVPIKLVLDASQVYSQDQIDGIVELFLAGVSREKLDPILDVCVAAYLEQLDEDGQVDFKSKAKIFTRAYDFLGAIFRRSFILSISQNLPQIS